MLIVVKYHPQSNFAKQDHDALRKMTWDDQNHDRNTNNNLLKLLPCQLKQNSPPSLLPNIDSQFTSLSERFEGLPYFDGLNREDDLANLKRYSLPLQTAHLSKIKLPFKGQSEVLLMWQMEWQRRQYVKNSLVDIVLSVTQPTLLLGFKQSNCFEPLGFN